MDGKQTDRRMDNINQYPLHLSAGNNNCIRYILFSSVVYVLVVIPQEMRIFSTRLQISPQEAVCIFSNAFVANFQIRKMGAAPEMADEPLVIYLLLTIEPFVVCPLLAFEPFVVCLLLAFELCIVCLLYAVELFVV